MITIEHLKKYYGKELVLDDINLEIKQGDIYAIVGHSGAGKSTLLRCMNGLEGYQEGKIFVFGNEIKEISKKGSSALRALRKDMGMIFQHFALINRKNVFDNIAMPLEVHRYTKTAIKSRVNELLHFVGLDNKGDSYPSTLSGGQKQRVAIARSLALNPKVLLSDEATSALDPNTTKNILSLLQQINKEYGITIVLVTHEMEVVKEIAHKAILLNHGQIIGANTIENLFLKPDKKMQEFLGESDLLPEIGINIKLFFPKEVAQQSIITNMARTLDVDFNIVWGKIEKLNGTALGSLVINIDEEHKDKILHYIAKSGVLYEVA